MTATSKLGATIVALLIAIAATTIFLTVELRSTSAQYRKIVAGPIADSQLALQTQVMLKTQVQNWKDTLLRGSDPTQLANYGGQFHNNETQVQTLAKTLQSHTTDANLHSEATDFIAQYNTLVGQYDAAFQPFVASDGKDFKSADASVKGKDRPPSDLLTKIVTDSQSRADHQVAAQRLKVQNLTQAVYIGLAVLGIGLAALALLAINSLLGLNRSLRKGAKALTASSRELISLSGNLATSSRSAAVETGEVTQSSVQVNSSMQTVATAMEEMTISISEIANSASLANNVADDAVVKANTASNTVNRLGDRSLEIGRVIELITSIAEQTNLLALNATIEAARAGEAGKGFAVVANEVKELAKATAEATEEIGTRVQAIQSDTTDTVSAIDAISEVIARVGELQATIAGAVEEQTATANEISANVNAAAGAADGISQRITGISTSVSETDSDAGRVNSMANDLGRLAMELQKLVSNQRNVESGDIAPARSSSHR